MKAQDTMGTLALRVRTTAAGLALMLLGLSAADLDAQVTGQVDGAEEEPRRYRVEIILFRYDDSVTAGTEVFLPDAPPPMANAAFGDDGRDLYTGSEGDSPYFGDRPPAASERPLADGDIGEAPVQPNPDGTAEAGAGDELLPSTLEEIVTGAASIDLVVTPRDELSLTGVYDRLEQLDAYEPVLWSGWTQIVRDAESTPAIDLRRLGRLPLEFDGELSLYLGRFVHLVVDIALEEYGSVRTPFGDGSYPGQRRRRDGAGDAAYERPWNPRVRYRIEQDSILRNGEMRYFDHPRFGLIAQLTLVEEAEPADPLLDDSDDLLPAGVSGGNAVEGSSGQ